ncbi:HAMP domain-containing protein [Saccharopolyspora sp. ID03-671]|uniref:HAMP domain-containing protein n=1 Tax=Saccharopolyspora sp. ID03-671 TaxID=3073066 RepID=UPI003254B979
MDLGPDSSADKPGANNSDPPKLQKSWVWGRLTIQSRLLVMLLSASIIAVLVAGLVGYESGSSALSKEAYDHIITARDARARQAEALFADVRESLAATSVAESTRSAMSEFGAAFGQLADAPVSPADRQKLEQYYRQDFVPRVHATSGTNVTAENLLPRSNQQIYLQAHYLSTGDQDDAPRPAITDAGDGSAWSAAHLRYGEYFRALQRERGYEDVMLVDPGGNVVYSADGGIQLGANLFGDAFNKTELSEGVRDVFRSNAVNEVKLTDFEQYMPKMDRPAAFGITPIGVGGKLVGAMVIQLSVDRINEAMTADENWRGTGLGETGEVYLVGDDERLRSTSRLLVQDPEAYRTAANNHGMPPGTVDEIVAQRDPILRQEVDSDSIRDGLNGGTGIAEEDNYLGDTVLTNYAPLADPDLNWAVVGQMHKSEALAPVRSFTRNIGLVALLLVVLVTVASMMIARAFTRPITRLLAGAERLSSGDLDTRIPVRSRDEFGDLTVAFNTMGDRLRAKQDQLDEVNEENDRLLTNVMPEPVAERYRAGEDDITTESDDACVIVAAFTGPDEADWPGEAAERRERLNELVRSVEDAAETAGVELVHVSQLRFIATCGLVVPRVDTAQRTLDFGTELLRIIAGFHARYAQRLVIEAGIDTGSLAGGLLGRRTGYDVWGEALDSARRVARASGEPGIYVSSAVRARVRDSFDFAEVDAGVDGQPVWRLDEGPRR